MVGPYGFRARGRRRNRAQGCGGLGIVGCRALVCLALAFGVCLSPVLAAERGSIRGMVQSDGQKIAQHRVMLIRFGPNREVQRTPGQTDAEGGFVFDNLETGDAFEYVVGIRYDGHLYQSQPVRLQAGQHRTGVLVEVKRAATAPDPAPPSLHITNHLKAILYRDDHLEIREVVTLLNPVSSVSPDTTETAEAITLHLALPPGYTRLMGVQGLDPQHVRLLPSGLYYTAPLAAGEQRILYSYTLPFSKRVTTLLAQHTLPTALLDIIVEDQHLIASSDLQFRGRVPFQPHTFWHFRGVNLPANSRSWIQLTRQTAASPVLRVIAYGTIAGLVCLGLLLPLSSNWRRRTRQSPTETMTEAQARELNASRLHLLQTIAGLDEHYQQGKLDTETYQQQRQRYKAQLVELFERLQEAQQDKDGSTEDT